MSEPLRERLLAVAGVEDAAVDGSEDAPASVRVTLAAEADAEEVGREVQRVLAAYGIRARVGTVAVPDPVERQRPVKAVPPAFPDGPPPPPGAPARVLSLPGAENWGPRRAAPGGVVAEQVAVEVEPSGEPGLAPRLVTGARIEGLSVEESRDGVLVRATTEDGRSTARRARWSEGGVNEAVLAAVADLAGIAGPPLLVDVAHSVVDGTNVVTVVLEQADGTRTAGAAVVEAGSAYAVARAVWRALAE